MVQYRYPDYHCIFIKLASFERIQYKWHTLCFWSNSYTTLRDFASLGNRSGIELVLVGMGMSNRDIDFARSRLIGNVFNVEDGLLEYQETVLRSITDKICEGQILHGEKRLNSFFFFIAVFFFFSISSD